MISEWLATSAREAPSSDTPAVAQHPLPHGCKAIIAPYVYIADRRHAGYRFAGPTFAWAYQCIDPDNVYVAHANAGIVYLSWDLRTTPTWRAVPCHSLTHWRLRWDPSLLILRVSPLPLMHSESCVGQNKNVSQHVSRDRRGRA